jgi:hypothetical protein
MIGKYTTWNNNYNNNNTLFYEDKLSSYTNLPLRPSDYTIEDMILHYNHANQT